MSAPSYRRVGRTRVLGALILLAAPLLFAATAGAAPPPGTPAMRQTAELVSIPLGTEHMQGLAVELSADGLTLAVAAKVDYTAPSSVVVYVRSGEGWRTQTILRQQLNTDGASPWWGQDIAISADGDTLAVTDEGETVLVEGTKVPNAGVIHLFTRAGQTWRAAGRLVAPRPRMGGGFGNAVAVSGDGSRVAVTGTDGAYITDTGSRVMRNLPLPPEVSRNIPSVAISPDGSTVVVGAPDGTVRPYFGDAFVLVDHPVAGWVQRWRLEAQLRDTAFGYAVAVSDTGTVVVGAPGRSDGVSVFDRRGADLVRTAKFSRPETGRSMDLGHSVAVSADGSTVVAGAPFRSADELVFGRPTINAGAAYRWVRSPAGWSWGGFLSVGRPHDREFQGWSTSVSGDGRVVVVGAPGRSSARLGETGAAMVYSAVP